MDVSEVCALIGRVAAVDVDGADRGEIEAAASQLRRVKSWIEGREVALARCLAKMSSFPEKALGDATRAAPKDAAKTLARARTVEAAPLFGAAMDAGDVSAAHVDVLGRVLSSSNAEVRERIIDHSPSLVAIAGRATPQEFARTVEGLQRKYEVDADREARLTRQRGATKLRTWFGADGMGRVSGQFDPQTAVDLFARLDRTVETVFREHAPACCPTDPGEKQDFLRAHALLRLLDGPSTARHRSEAIVVIDATDIGPDGRPNVDWGSPVALPDSCVSSFLATAATTMVVVANGRVVDAPGRLDLGREARVATFAQRRALAGLYAACAIPGCTVGYWRSKLHHIHPWELGGPTDLGNLLPLRVRHHHAVHDDGWEVSIDADRRLTVTLPDGGVMTTGPPHRRAA